MKTAGKGFKYWLDGEQIKDFDTFEKKIKNINVKINVEGLNLYAKSGK